MATALRFGLLKVGLLKYILLKNMGSSESKEDSKPRSNSTQNSKSTATSTKNVDRVENKSVLIEMPIGQTEMVINTPGTSDYFYIKYEEIKLINIKVRAETDAYIALSFCSDIPIYEVLIGTSGNTKTIIYYSGNEVAMANTQFLLSPSEYREFWLSWNTKAITLGRKGNSQGFISWENSDISSDITFNVVGLKTVGCYGTWEISVEPVKRQLQTENASFINRNQPERSNEKNLIHNESGKNSPINNDLPDLLQKNLNLDVPSTYQSNFPKQNAEKEQLSNASCNLNNIPRHSNLSNNRFQDGTFQEKNEMKLSTNLDLNPNLKKYFPPAARPDTNKSNQSDNNEKLKKRIHLKNNIRKENETNTFDNQKQNQSKFNEISENLETIIPHRRLISISIMSAEMIVCELRYVKFEMLFETTLTFSYLNLITKIMSKLLKADFSETVQTIILDLFLKDIFLRQLLNYVNKIPRQTQSDYEKHKRFTTELWQSLYDICRKAWSIEKHLENRFWLNIVFDCYVNLFKLTVKDNNLTEIKDLFLELKRNICDELRLKGIIF